MKLVHWLLMGGLLHLVQRGGDWVGPSPPRPLLAVPNVTAHPSTVSVPITIFLYNCRLLCGFKVAIRGQTNHEIHIVLSAAASGFILQLQVMMSSC